MLNNQDFKEYRGRIGFANQNDLKMFLSAKDIKSDIDYSYIDNLTQRLKEIVTVLNSVVDSSVRVADIDAFCKNYIDNTLSILKKNSILPRLNNQGRRPEQVYFSWRGGIVAQFFIKAVATIFNLNENDIKLIGKDKLDAVETFSRQATADLELVLNKNTVRLEIQSGYQGINDIKEHKVREARKQFQAEGIHSVVVHFDLFNGQVAFVNISRIQEDDINWITRQQMEGQTVFNINQNFFIWKVTDKCPTLQSITECVFE